MSFLDIARRRCSIRKFDRERQIPESATAQILEAAMLAPTAKNRQPQKIFILSSPEALSKLEECTPCVYQAPQVFLICYDRQLQWVRPQDNFDGGLFDACIVTTHMMMQATMAGIGSVWVENFDPEKLRQAFDLPETLFPAALLPVGYPADDCPDSPNHLISRSMEECVTVI